MARSPIHFNLCWGRVAHFSGGSLRPSGRSHDRGPIESILEYPNEDWMRFYRVYDDPPINESITAPRRKGKRRRRVDIKLDSSEVSPYTRFCFEAKRLGKGNPVSRYLGTKGLGCFLSGSYAGAEQRGGMLGYVQSDDEQTWAAKIDKAFTSILRTFFERKG